MIFFQAILCICKCCFWCLEKFMKFINRSFFQTKGCWFIKYFRNAYILTASQGTNFCRSAKQAFGLIFRNMVSNQKASLSPVKIIFSKVRVAVLDKVTDFLLFLGKLVVTVAVALLSFLYFSGGINSDVSCSGNDKP